MKNLLITGGTVFVSRFAAQYFKDNYQVYVLNRGSRPQVPGVTHICADRHALGDTLRQYHFDAVLDVCAYTAADVNDLLDALNPVQDYILISSSAVYPETNPQPFAETQPVGPNAVWGAYGTNKIAAEQALLARQPGAYILRPPYLYGPMQNVYREPFVFDCALAGRPFYIPRDGEMRLQFFHVRDLCRVIEAILETHPQHRIYNVGNGERVTVSEFVRLCYAAAGAPLAAKHVHDHPNQRDYFCFHDYEYALDITRQKELLPDTVPLADGLKESLNWYTHHPDGVNRRDYAGFIDSRLCPIK